MVIIGVALLVLSFLLIAAVNKQHREETGVSMPSRAGMKRIRRNARQKGISEEEAYDRWVKRKQQLEGLSRSPLRSKKKKRQLGAPLAEVEPVKPPRVRAPPHEPFDFEHLKMLAATYGWTLKQQAFGLYYLHDRDGELLVNPYAEGNAITTDFNQRDLEDFLLTT